MVKSRIEVWLKDRDNLYLQLPVNPESVSIESPFSVNNVNIASLGEVGIVGERGLKRLSFSSFFPRDYNSSYCEYDGFITPWQWVDQIEAWRDSRHNIRIIVAGTPVSIPVFVEDFTLEPERAGSPGDIYYSISLVEYRPIRPRVIAQSPTAVLGMQGVMDERPASDTTQATSYTVVRGDSLWRIAKQVYGNGAQYPKIYDANRDVIGKNPNLIYPGQRLVIP